MDLDENSVEWDVVFDLPSNNHIVALCISCERTILFTSWDKLGVDPLQEGDKLFVPTTCLACDEGENEIWGEMTKYTVRKLLSISSKMLASSDSFQSMDKYFGGALVFPERVKPCEAISIVPCEIIKNKLRCKYAVQNVDINHDEGKAVAVVQPYLGSGFL